MGRAFAGGWFLIDLFCAMAIVAKTIFCRGSRAGCEQFSPRRRHACHRTSHSITTTRTAGFPRRFVFAQASSVQTDADVRGGEADQRRSELVEPHRPRLSLLVATVADAVRLVGGQDSGMVQALFCRLLLRGRNYRALFHLGATTPETDRCRTADFSPTCDRAYRQLLLFQSAHDRVVLVAHRRCIDRASSEGASFREPGVTGTPRSKYAISAASIFYVRSRDRASCDLANQCVANFQRV